MTDKLTACLDFRGGHRGGRYDRYDDRRGGGRRYDDGYRSGRYDSYYSDRRDYGRRDYHDGYRGDRYGTREDRYSTRDDRRSYYERDRYGGYGDVSTREAREPYGRAYDSRGDDRYGGAR